MRYGAESILLAVLLVVVVLSRAAKSALELQEACQVK